MWGGVRTVCPVLIVRGFPLGGREFDCKRTASRPRTGEAVWLQPDRGLPCERLPVEPPVSEPLPETIEDAGEVVEKNAVQILLAVAQETPGRSPRPPPGCGGRPPLPSWAQCLGVVVFPPRKSEPDPAFALGEVVVVFHPSRAEGPSLM